MNIREIEVSPGVKVKVSVDNACRELASKIEKKIVAKVGRKLTAVEQDNVSKMSMRQALTIKAKEQVVRNERQKTAEVLAKDTVESLAFVGDNVNFFRYALDKIAQATIQCRVYNKGTGSPRVDDNIELADDIAGLFEDINLDSMVDDMTELRDNRKRVANGESAKAKKEATDNPIFAEIEKKLPSLCEAIMAEGATIAKYALKHIGKTRELQILPIKEEALTLEKQVITSNK